MGMDVRDGFEMARPPRFEHGTLALEMRCSIQLSYGRLSPSYHRDQGFSKSPGDRFTFNAFRNTSSPAPVTLNSLKIAGKIFSSG